TINPAFAGTRTAQILSLEDFEKTAGEEISITIARSADFSSHIPQWQKLDDLQVSAYQRLVNGFDQSTDGLSSKYSMFQRQYAAACGSFFLCFFLGLAFLSMLASMLWFMILSGAGNDIGRYDSLRKLGV